MNQSPVPYPANPQQVAHSVTEPTAAFKSEVTKVLGAIIAFFVVYLLLVALSIALSIACVYLGIMLMGFMRHWLAIVAGLGIISIGIMVFIFLIKFIFSVKKYNDAGTVTVTEAEQPVLFEFIRRLTKDTQTPFPKKIVLSADVNASVFYNDSFWSMLFPVRKNLQIGLGLVNTLTLSEFKAVMAHEFGHFSQRSMKLGSFVYNVNKVIYNMLYENKDFAVFLSGWGNLHFAIGIFVQVTIQLVKGIQKILQAMYGLINKSYMSLSRQMEFHADAVAASVSGSNSLITALRKAEVSDVCYNSVLQKANDWLKEKASFTNIYDNHNTVMEYYAAEFKLPLQNNAPVVTDNFLNRFQQSRVNIKDQWASHPSREDRETHLNKLNIEAAADNRPAWVLFTDPEAVQLTLTGSLYESVPADAKQKQIDNATFKEQYLKEMEVFTLPEQYKGYYDSRSINDIDIEKVLNNTAPVEVSKENFDRLFTDEKLALPKQLLANQGDVQLLEAIISKQVNIKSFDFDGEKYNVKDAAALLEKIKAATEQQEKQLQADDEELAVFFYTAALQQSHSAAAELKEKYRTHFVNRKKTTEFSACCQRVLDEMTPLMMGQQVSISGAEEMASSLRAESESMRNYLKDWMTMGVFDHVLNTKESVAKFINTHYRYFSGDSFFDFELRHLNELITDSTGELSKYQYKSFKNILQYQLNIFDKRMI